MQPVTFVVTHPPILPRFPRSWRYCNEWTWMDEAHARHGSSRFVRHAEDCACTPPTQVFVIESTTVEERVYDILKRKVDIRDSLL